MKKLCAMLCIAIASLTQLQAQAPQGFNYQATVRNSSGDLIVNTNVYFKFNVMQGSQTSLPVFTEIHYVPTDDLGQVSLVIGQGTATTDTFSNIDWSLGSYYLGIELDTGSGYVAMGTTQLLSVPYALYSNSSGNSNGLPNQGSEGQILSILNGKPTWVYFDSINPCGNSSFNQTWYIDEDGDGYGFSSGTSCKRPANGYLLNELTGTGNGTDDCNDQDSNEFPGQTWYIDSDGDGYGSESIISCLRPVDGYLFDELTGTGNGTDDCNDQDSNEFPGQTWYIDSDGDGYGSESIISCLRPVDGYLFDELTGTGNGTDDCNDQDSNEFPGQTWYIDSDGDGYGSESIISCLRPVDGYLFDELTGTGNGTDDCNDQDSNEFPGQTWYIDSDGDGYGSESIISCLRPVDGYLFDELTGTGNGTDDCNDQDSNEFPGQTWYIDSDGDGYGSESIISCLRPADGYLFDELTGAGNGTDDCNDINELIKPYADELNDGIDNDCDGEIDEAFGEVGHISDAEGNNYDFISYGNQTWTVEDAKMSTYRDGTPIPQVIDSESWENLTTGAWCYFNNDPTKAKLYNWYAVAGIHDNDPNTPNKEFAPEGWHVPSKTEWENFYQYLNDNYVFNDNSNNTLIKYLSSDNGWVTSDYIGSPGNNQNLNNELKFNAFPNGFRFGASLEGVNSQFNDVFNNKSEGRSAYFWLKSSRSFLYSHFFYFENDSGYVFRNLDRKTSGNSVRFVRDGEFTTVDNDNDGYSENQDDCNDQDSNEFPGQTWYIDSDGDGYGSESIISCLRPADGYLFDELTGAGNGTDDCNDEDASINPGAIEVCDGIDNNCNNQNDDNSIDAEIFYFDFDGDGYGDINNSITSCNPPFDGYVIQSGDCNDQDSNEFPGQTWYIDSDGDGYGSESIISCLNLLMAICLMN